MKKIKKSLGKYLKDCRMHQGLRQHEVSKALGWQNSQFVSNIERELCDPPKKDLRLYCEVVGAKKERVIILILTELEGKLSDLFKSM